MYERLPETMRDHEKLQETMRDRERLHDTSFAMLSFITATAIYLHCNCIRIFFFFGVYCHGLLYSSSLSGSPVVSDDFL